MNLTAAEAVRRALHAAKNCPTHYALGKGGMHPEHECPGDSGKLDCSGFVAYCLGISREQPHTLGWIETTHVYNDAKGKHALFQRVTEALPGDVIVYPDGSHEGHIGLITSTHNGTVLRVCHCNARSGLKSAIIDEPASVFWTGAIANRGAIFARYKGFTEDEDMLKPVVVVKDGTPYKGVLDAEKGITYVELRAMIPTGEFQWDEKRTRLTVKTR